MPSEFYSGSNLTKQIKEIMAGKNPKMCVAFLGPEWVKQLFQNGLPADLKVICDIKMQLTTRKALENGGAPNNKRLRHLPDNELHSKIYLSDIGAIVCSANASERALSGSNRIEDGIWVGPNSKVYKKILKEFETRYNNAKPVDTKALNSAPKYVNNKGSSLHLPNGLTLVEALRQNPAAFGDIRFVCTQIDVDDTIITAADERLEKEGHDENDIIEKEYRDYFSDWKVKENDWPAFFISIHLEPGKRLYLGKRRRHKFLKGVVSEVDPEDVFIATELDWNFSGGAFGGLPEFADETKCKKELKQLLSQNDVFSEYFAGKILTGEEFAARLNLQ